MFIQDDKAWGMLPEPIIKDDSVVTEGFIDKDDGTFFEGKIPVRILMRYKIASAISFTHNVTYDNELQMEEALGNQNNIKLASIILNNLYTITPGQAAQIVKILNNQ